MRISAEIHAAASAAASASPGTRELRDAVCGGDRRALGRAITLVESTRADHRRQANALLRSLSPASGNSVRVGISGMPGVGKSTLIEALGNHIADQGHRLAVLSVDPSSPLSGGSVLADKTRMETLARRTSVFIRPSPAGRTLGGVARHTREAILICEAAGFDVVLVETVGVGQSEATVAEMTDMFVLMQLPGSGDEFQGIKRGVMELADVIVVSKADGDMLAAANRTASEFGHAVRLLQPRSKNWEVPVLVCSAVEGHGIESLWCCVEDFRRRRLANGEFNARRSSQARAWLWSETTEMLLSELRSVPAVRERIERLETVVAAGELPASVAAAEIAEAFLQARQR